MGENSQQAIKPHMNINRYERVQGSDVPSREEDTVDLGLYCDHEGECENMKLHRAKDINVAGLGA